MGAKARNKKNKGGSSARGNSSNPKGTTPVSKEDFSNKIKEKMEDFVADETTKEEEKVPEVTITDVEPKDGVSKPPLPTLGKNLSTVKEDVKDNLSSKNVS